MTYAFLLRPLALFGPRRACGPRHPTHKTHVYLPTYLFPTCYRLGWDALRRQEKRKWKSERTGGRGGREVAFPGVPLDRTCRHHPACCSESLKLAAGSKFVYMVVTVICRVLCWGLATVGVRQLCWARQTLSFTQCLPLTCLWPALSLTHCLSIPHRCNFTMADSTCMVPPPGEIATYVSSQQVTHVVFWLVLGRTARGSVA